MISEQVLGTNLTIDERNAGEYYPKGCVQLTDDTFLYNTVAVSLEYYGKEGLTQEVCLNGNI